MKRDEEIKDRMKLKRFIEMKEEIERKQELEKIAKAQALALAESADQPTPDDGNPEEAPEPSHLEQNEHKD